jgi:hypothetical protein
LGGGLMYRYGPHFGIVGVIIVLLIIWLLFFHH